MMLFEPLKVCELQTKTGKILAKAMGLGELQVEVCFRIQKVTVFPKT